MPTATVYNKQGDSVRSIELSDAVFGLSEKEKELSETELQQRRGRLFYEAVRYQQAKKRSGNHATKSRSMISGGGKKPYRQKGTGRARQGTTRAVHWRGGAVVHGPHPRSHALKMNKTARKSALRAALAHRVQEDSVRVFDSLSLESIKTKSVCQILNALDMNNVLFVTNGNDSNFQKSARNISGISIIAVEGLNVYDILKHKKLAFSQETAESIIARLS